MSGNSSFNSVFKLGGKSPTQSESRKTTDSRKGGRGKVNLTSDLYTTTPVLVRGQERRKNIDTSFYGTEVINPWTDNETQSNFFNSKKTTHVT